MEMKKWNLLMNMKLVYVKEQKWKKMLKPNFEGECAEVDMYLAMARLA